MRLLPGRLARARSLWHEAALASIWMPRADSCLAGSDASCRPKELEVLADHVGLLLLLLLLLLKRPRWEDLSDWGRSMAAATAATPPCTRHTNYPPNQVNWPASLYGFAKNLIQATNSAPAWLTNADSSCTLRGGGFACVLAVWC